ncbi:MAG: ABC transporter ATP-binding protein [Lachnospiraceae bacterium]|nr:ABC transporter ATP-binding protein [Lachnospiraceae bacterium]
MKEIKHAVSNVFFLISKTFHFAKGQYFLSGFSFIWNTLTPFVNLYFPKWILDALMGRRRWEFIIFLLCMWAVVNGVIILVKNGMELLGNPYGQYCYEKELLHYYRMEATMDYSRQENGETLDEMGRIAGNMPIAYFAEQILFDSLSKIIQLVGYTYILSTLHPLIVLFLLLVILLNSRIEKNKQKWKYTYQQKKSKYNRRFQYLFDAMAGYEYAKEIRINGAAAWLEDKYQTEKEDYLGVYRQNEWNNFFFSIGTELLNALQTFGLYLYSAHRAFEGTITIGDFSLYAGTVSRFINCFKAVVGKLHELSYLSRYIDDYKRFVELSKGADDRKSSPIEHVAACRNEFVFENVSFKYPNTDSWVLKHVSFQINSGERLAVVGYNGAGKSTLIKLLCGLYEPTEGRILYNGQDITKLNYRQYTESLSVIFQDYNIYSMPVWENICLNAKMHEKRVMQAIEDSGLTNKIRKLPLGLETEVGKEIDEGGIEFSGGEGQRLVTARAFYKCAPVCFLDEPTAALDAVAESQLYERFDKVIGNKTAIYITHRLSGVKFCDKVIVFADGELIEQGTHKELLAAAGVYAEMFRMQAKHYESEGVDRGGYYGK